MSLPQERSTAEQVFYTWVARSRSGSSSFTASALNKPSSSSSSSSSSPRLPCLLLVPLPPTLLLLLRSCSQPTCRARGCRDRLGIPKPPPPGGGHAPRGAPSTRAARSLGRTHRPRLPGVRCPRATSCQRPPCVSRAAHHRAKRRAGVWCSLPMLGPCAQRQRYATACCAYRPTFIRCLSINPPPPPPPPSSSSSIHGTAGPVVSPGRVSSLHCRGPRRHQRCRHRPLSSRRALRLHRHIFRPEHHSPSGQRSGAQAQEGLLILACRFGILLAGIPNPAGRNFQFCGRNSHSVGRIIIPNTAILQAGLR